MKVRSLCSSCNRYTNQKVLAEKTSRLTEEDGGWWEEDKYQIIQCEGCDTLSFRKLHSDAQQAQYADYDDERYTQEVFPKRSEETLPIKALMNTPTNVKKIYRETIDAYNNDQPILCAVGIRAIIEAICNDKKIEGGECLNGQGKLVYSKQLNGKIEGLFKHGYLTKSNSEVLHDLRFLGNQAVHELSSPSQEELRLAIEILEHSLDNIYELKRKARRLKDKMDERNKKE